jgi:hypothetical protein
VRRLEGKSVLDDVWVDGEKNGSSRNVVMGVDWIRLWRAFVNAVTNLRVS